jgi:hypothetical protein
MKTMMSLIMMSLVWEETFSDSSNDFKQGEIWVGIVRTSTLNDDLRDFLFDA